MKYLALTTLIFLSLIANSAIHYVDANDPGIIQNGNSWGTAYNQIQKALEEAVDGDQIWVADGFYAGEVSIPYLSWAGFIEIYNSIELYGGFGGFETSLNQRNPDIYEANILGAPADSEIYGPYAIRVNGADDVIVDGFQFTSYATENVFQLFCATSSDNVQIRNCQFSNSTANGIANLGFQSTAKFTNCEFINISTTESLTRIPGSSYELRYTFDQCSFLGCDFSAFDGERCAAVSTFDKCVFDECNFEDGDEAAGFFLCDFKETEIFDCNFGFLSDACDFDNCLIHNNTAQSTTQNMFYISHVYNSTIVDNAFLKSVIGGSDLERSIISGNVSVFLFPILDPNMSNVSECVIQQEHAPASDCVVADPVFVDEDNRDYHLTECSPAINLSSVDVVESSVDLDQNPRSYGETVDAGCYELQVVSKARIYVDENATGSNAGTSWSNAYVSLSHALSQSCSISQIWVAEGNYSPDDTPNNPTRSVAFEIPDGVELYGGFEGYETSLDQREDPLTSSGQTSLSGILGAVSPTDNSYNIVRFESPERTAVIDGFAIRYSYADGSGNFGFGGGILVDDSKAIIRNCRFEACTANNGACIAVLGNSTTDINNCFLDFNTALSAGGGIYIDTPNIMEYATTIDRVRFFYNNSNGGGGIYVDQGFVFNYNSLFNANSGPSGGAAAYIATDAIYEASNLTVYDHIEAFYVSGYNTVYNSIFWENDIDVFESSSALGSIFSFCNLGNGAYSSNISQDPQFINPGGWEFGLQSFSPSIDEGMNSFVEGALDFGGVNRISNGLVDHGAFEWDSNCNSDIDYCSTAFEYIASDDNSMVFDVGCASNGNEPEDLCNNVVYDQSKTVWVHFEMPDSFIEVELSPQETTNDILLRIDVFVGDCSFPAHINCATAGGPLESVSLDLLNTFILPGQDVYLRLSALEGTGLIKLITDPVSFSVPAVDAISQTECTGDGQATFDQTVVVAYLNEPASGQLVVNGQLFPITGTPQWVTLEDLPATGEVYDLEVGFTESLDSFIFEDIIYAPCCEPENDDCFNAIPIQPGDFKAGRLDCATPDQEDFNECSTAISQSVWYSFTGPQSGQVSFLAEVDQNNVLFDLKLSIYEQSCDDLASIGCENSNEQGLSELLVSNLAPGYEYFLMVSNSMEEGGSFELTFLPDAQLGCPGDFDASGVIDAADLLFFLSEWACTNNCQADMTGDDAVDAADLLAFLAVFGETCD